MLAATLCLLPPLAARAQWTTRQLTDNDFDECEGLISNSGKAAWTSSCEAGLTGDAYYWDGESARNVSRSENRRDWFLDMNDDGLLVWVAGGLFGGPIVIYDGEDDTFWGGGGTPRLNNIGHGVWDLETFRSYEIYFWDGSRASPITNNDIPDRYPVINDSDTVCWTAWDPDAEILCREGETVTPLTDNDIDDWYQEINSSGQLAWMGGECPFSCEIYFYDGATVTPLTSNSFDDWHPRISDSGQVTWWGVHGLDSQVFLYDGTTVSELGSGGARHPEINDTGTVVWQQRDGADLDIFLYDGERTHQITDDCEFDDERPDLNDHGAVLWHRYDGTDFEIMLAEPAGPVTETQWVQTLGGQYRDSASDVWPTADGGFLVAGETASFEPGGAWLVKLDAAGRVEWQTSYGDGGGTIEAVREVSTGGYLLAGRIYSEATGSDAWVVKLAPGGALEWQKRIGGPLDDWGMAVEESGSCGYLIAGATKSHAAGESDLWLFELDAAGDLVWEKTYGGANIEFFGGLVATRDGGIALSGATYSFDLGNGDFWVLKLDAAGTIEWERTYGLDTATIENGEDPARIAQTADGGFVLAGGSAPLPSGNVDAWVLKLDASGAIEWQQRFNTGADLQVDSVAPTGSGTLVAGSWGGGGIRNGWLMKLDASGGVEWQNSYRGALLGSYEALHAAHPTLDGGVIAVGRTESFGIAQGDAWLLKLDANGEAPDCPAIAGFSGTPEASFETDLASSAAVSEPVSSVSDTFALATDTDAVSEDGCRSRSDLIDLPETGQATPYHPGDDGDLRAGVPWPSPRFTDHGNGTLTDELTGLMWLGDGACALTIGHDPDANGDGRLAWTSALDFVAGINDGTHEISACGSASGPYTETYTDWRLPNSHEMESLLHAGFADRAAWLALQGFTNVQPEIYYTSTTDSHPTSNAITVHLDTSLVFHGRKGGSGHAWPVRGGQAFLPDPAVPANLWKTGQTISYHPGDDGEHQTGVAWPPERFHDNGDGTVTDNLTGLMWLKHADCFGELTLPMGLDAVADFNVTPDPFDCVDYTATHGDWRVPNRKELQSLVDRSRNQPALPAGHPFVGIFNYYYWTSTSEADRPAGAWLFAMQSGNMLRLTKTSYTEAIWPVRGGSAAETDTDGDGVPDVRDNCLRVENADQRDTNSDGYGNLCDADYDDDGAVGIPDFNVLRAQFGLTDADPAFDPDVDMDGDGGVGIREFNLLRDTFGGPPGPSGYACAGSVPCP
ncbi:MAG: DUF1566 domain-containing protein [Myxococcota bacterium]|nr:DUF1566 domain-containing protein [Myxococcota bacterium]